MVIFDANFDVKSNLNQLQKSGFLVVENKPAIERLLRN